MKFPNLEDCVVIRGEEAGSLKDLFIREVVANEPEDGFEKAAALQKADDYAILFELYEGILRFNVKIGEVGDAYIAFGPDFLKRLLNDAFHAIGGTGSVQPAAYAGAH